MKNQCVALFVILTLSSCGVEETASDGSGVEDLSCSPRNGDIRNMSDLVFFLNDLEKPLSLNCALGALPNGFQLNATSSQISVQPAHDRFQSRFFLAYENDIYLAIVPGENILEIGDVYDADLSVKGEIHFPLEDEITLALPYRNVSDDITTRKKCGAICHSQAVDLENMGGVSIYASSMIRPNPAENVSMEELLSYFEDECTESSDICKDYKAIFNHEDIQEYSFPDHIPFF